MPLNPFQMQDLADVLFPSDNEPSSSSFNVTAQGDSSNGLVSVENDGDVVAIPIIGSASAGDELPVLNIGGVPTAIATDGWGDQLSSDVRQARADAAQAAAATAYVTHIESGDDAGVHVHENADDYNTGGDFWINPVFAAIRKAGVRVAKFAEDLVELCSGAGIIDYYQDNGIHKMRVFSNYINPYTGYPTKAGMAVLQRFAQFISVTTSELFAENYDNSGNVQFSTHFRVSAGDRPTVEMTTTGSQGTQTTTETVATLDDFKPVLLWSGNWNSGQITVPDFEKYHRYIIYVGSENVPLEASRTDAHNRVIGSAVYATSTPICYMYSAAFSYSGNVLSYIHAAYSRLDTHAITKQAITEIWGVV